MLSLQPTSSQHADLSTVETTTVSDAWVFGFPSEMELVVNWGGERRTFEVVEFSVDEIVVVDFDARLDLRHHDATLDFCDGEVLDEIECQVAFRGFEGEGVARLKIIAEGWELMEVARLAEMLRERLVNARKLEHARMAAACGWI